MAEFTVQRQTSLPASAAFARITDWNRHKPPFTKVWVTSTEPPGVGTTFVARTAVGRWGFDDQMRVVEWVPPEDDRAGYCRIEKVGQVVEGWAEIRVDPIATGSRVIWHEVAGFRGPARVLNGVSALGAKVVFGRLVDRLLER